MQLAESIPESVSADSATLSVRDNSGVTELIARFPNGDIDVLAVAGSG